MTLHIAKGHGLGNDYLVVDKAVLPWPLTVERTRIICGRQRGLGSDGILIGDVSARPFRLGILNPDGSVAEKSGNGLRIFAAWLHGRSLVRTDEWFDVQLVKDAVRMRVEAELAFGAVQVRVEIGTASFLGRDVGFTPQPDLALGTQLDLPSGSKAEVNPVSMSNPHCVVFVDNLDRADFLERAPQLCTHAAFPAGTNVQFARVAGPDVVELWIWERGAGETLASGSSACAVTAVAVRLGMLPHGTFEARMPGGSVEVTVHPDFSIELNGPAQMIYEAELSKGLVALLA
jgi:diaminopimelate epimerase